MSEEFVNNWKPRKENILRFESGNACVVRKPGPELALKTSYLHRRLTALQAVSSPEGLTEEEQEQAGLDALERMTDEQRRASYEIMCVTVAACVVKPPLYVKPKPGQVGVSDIDETEFLAIWKWYKAGCPDITEEESEVTAADADRFPDEQTGGTGTGDLGGNVRPEAEPVAAV